MRLLVIACYVLTVCLTLYSELVSAGERPLSSSYKAAFPVDVTNARVRARDAPVPPVAKVQTNGLTDEMRQKFLDLHNHYRSLRNASNMLMMVYDKDVEATAQEWAERCIWEHSSNDIRANKAGFGTLGENMAGTTGDLNITYLMGGWYDEWVDFNFEEARCPDKEKMCGHYTQVVWATSKAVGCGVRFCQPFNKTPWPEGGHFTVCRYGPAGNARRVQPYKVGAPCSECPDDAKFCINGLCSPTAAPGTMAPGGGPMPGGGTPMPGGGTPMPGGETPMPGGDTTTMPPAGTAAIQPRTSWIGLMLMIVVHLIVIGTI